MMMRRRSMWCGVRLGALAAVGAALATLGGCATEPVPVNDPSAVCPIHNVHLKGESRPHLTAIKGASPAYLDAEQRLFPYAHAQREGKLWVLGNYDSEFVRYCPTCRKVEEQWQAEHPTLAP